MTEFANFFSLYDGDTGLKLGCPIKEAMQKYEGYFGLFLTKSDIICFK